MNSEETQTSDIVKITTSETPKDLKSEECKGIGKKKQPESRHRIDLTGRRFRKLLVIQRVKCKDSNRFIWDCQCECGERILCNGNKLIAGYRSSCGCLKHPKIIGNKVNYLTILSIIKSRDTNRHKLKCRCDCGRIYIGDYSKVYRGYRKSCTHKKCQFHREIMDSSRSRLSYGEASFNNVCKGYVDSAKFRGVEMLLTKDQMREMFAQSCTYCGCLPSKKTNHPLLFGDFIYNGIDRVNSDCGYEIANCVTCCEQCNRAKLDYTKEEFFDWIRRVHKHLTENKLL